MADCKVNFDSSILEGQIKLREKKKWKRRWCLVKRLSPVANSLTMQLYKKYPDKMKHSRTKASFHFEHLLGIETCFLLDKESHTLALICKNVSAVFAFDSRENLLEWHAQISEILGQSEKYDVQLLNVPTKFDLNEGTATLHIRDWHFALTYSIPPRLLGYWNMTDLRCFGAVDDRRFCFEGGSRCAFGGGEGLFVLGSTKSHEIGVKFELAVRGRLADSQRRRSNPTSPPGLQSPITRQRLSVSSRTLQISSKPSTPLLGAHPRAAELCLSPPCSRHLRSASQQHSRNSSISSGSHITRFSALQQSDPELLYDKPRSLNVTLAQITVEPCHNVTTKESFDAPENHYDTPRRVLQCPSLSEKTMESANLCNTETMWCNTTSHCEETHSSSTNNENSALYATVKKPKRKLVEEKEVKREEPSYRSEVEGYLVMQRSRIQWPEYVQMQPLPCSPLSLLKRDKGGDNGNSCLVPVHQCAYSCCHKYQNNSNIQNQLSHWLRRDEDGESHYRNSNSFKCHHSKPSLGTLPPLRHRDNGDPVNLRLRRSASMPCRQGNRDSSDSTDSGVSVNADSLHQPPLTISNCSHHVFSRHWSLPRPTIFNNKTRLQPWPNTSLCDADIKRTTASSSTGRDSNPTSSDSNNSNFSNLLDQLDSLSVASVGCETCV